MGVFLFCAIEEPMSAEKEKHWLQRNWLFMAGGGLTLVYLIWFFCSYETPFEKLELHEKGDFLAGLFAPLAFFWLVLGFIQQGQELKLQIKELNESVKAQNAQAKHIEQNSKHVAREVFLRVSEQYVEELAGIARNICDSRIVGQDGLVRGYDATGNKQILFYRLAHCLDDANFAALLSMRDDGHLSHDISQYVLMFEDILEAVSKVDDETQLESFFMKSSHGKLYGILKEKYSNFFKRED